VLKLYISPNMLAHVVLGKLIITYGIRLTPNENETENQQWNRITKDIAQEISHGRVLEADKILLYNFIVDVWNGDLAIVDKKDAKKIMASERKRKRLEDKLFEENLDDGWIEGEAD